ncbi:MAG: HAD family hydrolase [bacterium]
MTTLSLAKPTGIIFDLGNTLVIGSTGDVGWQNVLRHIGYRVSLKKIRKSMKTVEMKLLKAGISPETYEGGMNKFWTLYDKEILSYLGIKGNLTSLAQKIQDMWLDYNKIITPNDTIKTLNKLKSDGYKLAILSNAFEEEIYDAFNITGIDKKLFNVIAGFNTYQSKKPSPECYKGVLNELKISPQNAVMVGDQVKIDGIGARVSSIRFVHIVRKGKAKTPKWAERITSLNELPDLLEKKTVMNNATKK